MDVTFTKFKYNLADHTMNWVTTPNLRALLLGTAVATPDPDLNFLSQLVDGVNNIELVTTNYIRKDLTGRALLRDDTNNNVGYDLDDIVWAALGPATAGPTIKAAVMYQRIGADDSTPTDDPLICFIDLIDQPVNSGDYALRFQPQGLFIQ